MNETEMYRKILEEVPRAVLLVNNFPEEIGFLIKSVAFLVTGLGVVAVCYGLSLLFKPLAARQMAPKEDDKK